MLRVEPSNLPNPKTPLRPRRLLPHPAVIQRPGASKARHEMLPPRDDARTSSDDLTVPQASVANERWSVQLELGDADIAKLYGQGMTRGAVVWRKGMVEWRPLLVTPELTGLLRRTRTTLTPSPTPNLPPLPSWANTPPELPRPARVPSSLLPPALAESAVSPTTVAPTAMDVEPPRQGRRPVELAAVAVAAFALAWIGHGSFGKHSAAPARPHSSFASAPTPPAAAPAAECEPQAPPPRSTTPSSTIPTVSIADLPLAGARAAVAATFSGGGSRPAARATASSSGAPSRSDLMNALSGVARAAGTCGERGGPVRVVVSFANSGVARSIQVSGQDLPAATRSCIIGAASRARVPAFTGDPVTVAKSL